jgi:septal ring factor EnvC (AmiA/AmiB activator)
MTETNSHTLACKHTFHTSCIVQWFRGNSNACPLCKDENALLDLFGSRRVQCVKQIRTLARRKDCPRQIVKINNRIKKLEDELKHKRSEHTKYKKDNREVLKKNREFQRNRSQLRRRIRDAEASLFAYGQMHPIILRNNSSSSSSSSSSS